MADRYVVAWGNWSSTATWSATEGGAPGAAVPTSSDNVFAGPGMASAGTPTVDAAASCANLTFAAAGDASLPTFSLSGAGVTLTISGSVVLASGMTAIGTTGYTITMAPAVATTTTLTSNSVSWSSRLAINGAGTVQLVDQLTLSGASNLTRTLGTFDANGQTVALVGTAHTINNDFTGTSSFANLTRTGTATKTDSITLAGNVTVTGTLTINGNSAVNRMLVQSSAKGTARTITAATVSVTNADFQDIVGAGGVHGISAL